jgi:hypothetical protein
MTNRSKAKGTSWESAIVAFFKDCGWRYADRLTLSGSKDRGDVTLGNGFPVVIEAKCEKAITLAAYMAEVEAEKLNAGALVGMAWVKRPRKAGAADAYVVMSGTDAERLLHLAFGSRS